MHQKAQGGGWVAPEGTWRTLGHQERGRTTLECSTRHSGPWGTSKAPARPAFTHQNAYGGCLGLQKGTQGALGHPKRHSTWARAGSHWPGRGLMWDPQPTAAEPRPSWTCVEMRAALTRCWGLGQPPTCECWGNAPALAQLLLTEHWGAQPKAPGAQAHSPRGETEQQAEISGCLDPPSLP